MKHAFRETNDWELLGFEALTRRQSGYDNNSLAVRWNNNSRHSDLNKEDYSIIFTSTGASHSLFCCDLDYFIPLLTIRGIPRLLRDYVICAHLFKSCGLDLFKGLCKERLNGFNKDFLIQELSLSNEAFPVSRQTNYHFFCKWKAEDDVSK